MSDIGVTGTLRLVSYMSPPVITCGCATGR
jgi:hypothetical protein